MYIQEASNGMYIMTTINGNSNVDTSLRTKQNMETNCSLVLDVSIFCQVCTAKLILHVLSA